MALRVAFDMDGVLADFRSAFKAVARADQAPDPSDLEGSSERITQGEIRRAWRQIAQTTNWWTTLSAYEPDQIRRLYEVARREGWEVFFMTKRPATSGETVQYQTQWWLESQGYQLPAVLTIPGSRGEMANALRLDAIVDDQILNCIEVVSASPTRAILMLRESGETMPREDAADRGIGTVATLQEALDVLEHLAGLLREKPGPFLRLAQWFQRPARKAGGLSAGPRTTRRLPSGDVALDREPVDG